MRDQCIKLRCQFSYAVKALVVGCVASMASLSHAQLLINDFDSDEESWRYDFGGTGFLSHDPNEGSPGNAQGAIRLDLVFPFAGSIAFTGDVFGSETDLTSYSAIEFDLKVDPSSAQDAFGDYGFANLVSRETGAYTWGGQSGFNIPGTPGVWQSFSIPTTANGGLDMTATRAFTFQIYGGPAQNIPGPVTVWLDNVRAIPEPATVSLVAMTIVGGLLRRRS